MEINLVTWVVWALVLVRNWLVYTIRKRRIDQIHARALAAIHSGDLSRTDPYADFHTNPSYFVALLDLRKWTYESFYGKD